MAGATEITEPAPRTINHVRLFLRIILIVLNAITHLYI